jgi:hypothetical protein
MMLHVGVRARGGSSIAGAVNCGDPCGTLGEIMQLVLGGIVDHPQRFHREETDLGAAPNCVSILPRVTSHPPHSSGMVEGALRLFSPLCTPKDKALVEFRSITKGNAVSHRRR